MPGWTRRPVHERDNPLTTDQMIAAAIVTTNPKASSSTTTMAAPLPPMPLTGCSHDAPWRRHPKRFLSKSRASARDTVVGPVCQSLRMLEITVQTENGERHAGVSAEELAGLVRRIGGEGDRFLVIERIPDETHVFAQVWHATDDDYTVEHRDGSADRHFGARTEQVETVIAAVTGWARREQGWDGGLDWSLLKL